MDYQALANEISTDPLARGYSGMTDIEIAASLNTRDREIQTFTFSASDLFNAIDPTEYGSITGTVKEQVKLILGLGDDISAASGTNVRTVLVNAFGASSNTLTALQDAAKKTVSRAEELGFGRVDWRDVQYAKSL